MENENTDSYAGPTRAVKTIMALTLALFVITLMYSTNIFERPGGHFHHEITVDTNEIFVIAEIMPRLIGELNSIHEKVRYPETAKKAGIEGRVLLQFVVDENGEVVKPVVTRGIGGGCDEAALKALRTARFTPGVQGGKPVKVRMNLPIVFRLR